MSFDSESLDCRRPESHNANGSKSLIAPMKPKPISWVASLKEWHLSAVTLAFFALIWFGFANSSAQTKSAKRILSLRVNDEPEGSRVTVVSNLALGDYEAYRRGDRFHVKIPASEFATSEPHFRGKGFDDVQVQKKGDSVVISFKLQPGASARVDQRFNRLQVVFATVAGSDAGAASKSGLQSGLPPGAENGRRFSSQTVGDISSQQNRARRSRDVPVALAPNPPGGIVRDSRRETPGSDNSSGQRRASAEPNARTKTDTGNAGSSIPSPDANTSTYSPSDNTANSSSTSGLTDQSSASTPGANAKESRALSPVVKSTGSSFAQWLSLHWLQARILLLTLLSAVLLIAATVWRLRRTPPSVGRWKGEKVGPTQSTTVDEEPAIVDSSLPMLQDTVLSNMPQQHVEVTAETKPTLHLTSPQPATQEILVKSTEAESISHLPEVKEVIEEPPFSHSLQFERTDHEIKKLLAGQEYDANLIDAPDSATRQLVAVSLLTALSGRSLEQREPARKAFVDHGYFDETARDLRTGDSPAERAAAARKLGMVGDTLGTAHLVASLYDTVPEVRRAAVESLGQIGDPGAILHLNDLLARETSGLLPEATIRNAINSITLKEFKRKSTHDKRALRDVEKPVKLNSRVEANAAFIEFMDTIQRLEFETESLGSVAPLSSALPPVTLPENKSSITNEEEQLHLEEQALRRAAEDLEVRRKAAETARQKAEEEARLKARREAQARTRIEARIRAENEAHRRAEEEAARIKSEGEARIRAEQEEQARAEEEAHTRAEEEARFRLEAEALRRAAEELARKRADAEIAIKAADEVASRRREVEQARKIAEEEGRLLVAAQDRIRAEEEERKRAEEDRQRLEVEGRRAEEERHRLEEARRRATEEQKRIKEESRRQAEEEEQHLSELEAVRKKAQDHARQRAEIEQRIRAEIQALHKAEEEQRQRIEVETRRRAEAEARLREEQARRRVEEQSRQKVEEEARLAQESRILDEPETRLRVDEEPVVSKPALNDYSWADLNVGQDEITEAASAIHEGQPSRETVVNNPSPTEEPAKEIDAVRSENELAPVGGDSNISSELLNKLNSDSSAERSEALNDLARLGGEDAFRFINRLFDDQSADVRNAAARALYDLQSDRAATFTRALREGTPDRRRRIGAALAASGLASNAIANLTGESREKTYDAFSLLFLMAKAGEVQPLLRAIEDFPSVEVRLAVVKLLALSGQPEIVPAFRRLAVRGLLPPEVRAALMEAIYQISSQTRETPAA